jgi:protein-S-isoprenylcysteine O-methyltransferase Ste14
MMFAAILGLIATRSLFSAAPLVITAQFSAFALMVWARITFGRRSFHAAADPTKGGIITTGPYRFIRHPIYTAACFFVFTGAVAHFSFVSLGLALVVFVGAFGRMLAEERLLLKRYLEYADYAVKTKRMLPYVF